MSGATPGPWRWFGSPHGIYLATVGRGRTYVMGFRRMGLNGAQPVFRVANRMVRAAELVEFEVGDGTARGFAEGKADPSVYRYDIRGIDCPDARLIAAAPDLLRATKQALQHLEIAGKADGFTADLCRRAIAKATEPQP